MHAADAQRRLGDARAIAGVEPAREAIALERVVEDVRIAGRRGRRDGRDHAALIYVPPPETDMIQIKDVIQIGRRC
jgi:hypothetical protein